MTTKLVGMWSKSNRDKTNIIRFSLLSIKHTGCCSDSSIWIVLLDIVCWW